MKYDKSMGSGYFWCWKENMGWKPFYINALWGVCIDGIYCRTDNFKIIPLPEPEEPKEEASG